MVPEPTQYFLETPLYTEFQIDGDGAIWHTMWIEYFARTVDAHCVLCGQESVLQGLAVLPSVSPPSGGALPPGLVSGQALENETELGSKYDSAWLPRPGDRQPAFTPISEYAVRDRLIQTILRCTRCAADALVVLTRVHDGVLTKVGQFPSRADLEEPRLKTYRSILGEEWHREFVRRVGLAAHGIGIGSFVYLRRVFEHLVTEAAAEATEDPAWDAAAFAKLRMNDKIKKLEKHLPPFLVENGSLYGELSDGLHNLTESQCLEMFEPIRLSIEAVLDQRIEEKERVRKEAQARKAIGKMRESGGPAPSQETTPT